MVSSRFLYRLLGKVLISATILLIFFNEFAVYTLNRLLWNQIECVSGNCTRILLVADPQILGEDFDKSFYSSFAISDSDTYLKKTFRNALAFSNPQVVCFLGDLLDEGSIASTKKFKSYVQRFQSIFNVDSSVKKVHLPGDNDIGGENGEYISNSNVRRFEIDFMNDDITDFSHLRFFKINRMILDYSNPDKSTNDEKIRVALSHMPLLAAGGPLLRSIMHDIDPHVFFTAHWHDSKIFFYPSISAISLPDRRIETFNLERLKLEHQYLEIMIPTASYRMGKHKMGYGFAVFDGHTLKYTVLWSPGRFVYLTLYLMWIAISLVLVIVLYFSSKCPSKLLKRQHYDRISYIPHF